MLSYSLKNYLSLLHKNADKNKYEVTLLGAETKYTYNFVIFNGVYVTISENSVEKLMYKIENLEDCYFDDAEFFPRKFTSTAFKLNGKTYERIEQLVSFPAQLYIKLFRIMGERVSFTVKASNEEYLYCNYIDGKVLYTTEDDDYVNVYGTNLYRLHDTYPNFEILYVSTPVPRFNYGEYMDYQSRYAALKDKTVTRYKLGLKQ